MGLLRVSGKFACNSILAPDSTGERTRRLSFPNDGSSNSGVLHASWIAEATPSTSDRRLKYNINPLYKELKRHQQHIRRGLGAAGGKDEGEDRESATAWVLRQLRPVSFKFLAPESKSATLDGQPRRFGFIAQEVRRVMPNLVQGDPDGGSSQQLLYQDFLAVVTQALKEQQVSLGRQREEILEATRVAEELLREADALETTLDEANL